MTINARYPSTCPKCSRPIAVGDRVDWEKGRKAEHLVCPALPAPAPSQPVARPVAAARIAVLPVTHGAPPAAQDVPQATTVDPTEVKANLATIASLGAGLVAKATATADAVEALRGLVEVVEAMQQVKTQDQARQVIDQLKLWTIRSKAALAAVEAAGQL